MGAVLPPLLMFIAVFAFDEGSTFDMLFTNVNMYMSALFAIMLFSIMISYLFGRERTYPKDHDDHSDIQRKIPHKQICDVSCVDFNSDSSYKPFITCLRFHCRS